MSLIKVRRNGFLKMRAHSQWIIIFIFEWILIASFKTFAINFDLKFYEKVDSKNNLGIRRGNGIVLDRKKSNIWVTLRDGSLKIIPASSKDDETAERIHFQPSKLTNRATRCYSSVSLFENDGGIVKYGVYAVTDFPQSKTGTAVSRVFAISSNGQKLWEANLEGIVGGTPQISRDGHKIFVTHNAKKLSSGNYTDGRLSMIRHRNGVKSGINIAGEGVLGRIKNHDAPFSALTMSTTSEQLIYFGEAWDGGSAGFGFLYESDGEKMRWLIRTSWSAVAAPKLSSDGKSMWMVGSGSSVHGWVNGNSFDKMPSWSIWLEEDNKPILSSPLVTPDSRFAFVLTSNDTLTCLDASTGQIIWSNEEKNLKFQAIQLSPDGYYLYAMGNDDRGTLTQYVAQSGKKNFQVSCLNLFNDKSCLMPVEGIFDISRDGSFVFWGSIYGDIIGISIDETEDQSYNLSKLTKPTNTAVPSISFTTMVPSSSEIDQKTYSQSDHLSYEPTIDLFSNPIANAPSRDPLSYQNNLQPLSTPAEEYQPISVMVGSNRPSSEPRNSLSSINILLQPHISPSILVEPSVEMNEKPGEGFLDSPVIIQSPALSPAMPTSWSTDTIDEYFDDSNEVSKNSIPDKVIVGAIDEELPIPPSLKQKAEQEYVDSPVIILSPARSPTTPIYRSTNNIDEYFDDSEKISSGKITDKMTIDPISIPTSAIPLIDEKPLFEFSGKDTKTPHITEFHPFLQRNKPSSMKPNKPAFESSVESNALSQSSITGSEPNHDSATFEPAIFKVDLNSMMKASVQRNAFPASIKQTSHKNYFAMMLIIGVGGLSILAIGFFIGRLWQYDRESSRLIGIIKRDREAWNVELNL